MIVAIIVICLCIFYVGRCSFRGFLNGETENERAWHLLGGIYTLAIIIMLFIVVLKNKLEEEGKIKPLQYEEVTETLYRLK